MRDAQAEGFVKLLPGQAEASAQGYSLQMSDGKSTTYAKEFLDREGSIFLTVTEDPGGKLSAELSAYWKFIRISTGDIQFPNPLFKKFEEHVAMCIPKEHP